MNKVNEMVFAPDRYDDDVNAMWVDIAKFIKMLTDNEYVAVVRDDDIDIIVVEYEHDERIEEWGVPTVKWLTPEQVELLEDMECEECEE